MTIRENVPLAPFTTFRIGGPATTFIEVHSEEDIQAALVYAHERGLPLYVLGAGSNVLVPDSGVAGVVLRMMMQTVAFEDGGDDVLFIAGAGTPWESAVDAVAEHGLFGVENLAGIPGTVGGAAVQNIGAYGVELSNVFAYADVIHSATGEFSRIDIRSAEFAYRSSFFKTHRELIIMRVALRLAKHAQVNVAYADLARVHAEGVSLITPSDVVRAVRNIRAAKFPTLSEEGTAGSFFKNPIVSSEEASQLTLRFPGLPAFPQESGRTKLSLAWLLDHTLALKGYEKDNVRLYEKQPLVMVARFGACASSVHALAEFVRARVLETTNIEIEREVETFGVR